MDMPIPRCIVPPKGAGAWVLDRATIRLKTILAATVRAVWGVVGLALSVSVGLAAIFTSEKPPTSWRSLDAWRDWFARDPGHAAWVAIAALGAGLGLWFTLFAVFFSKAADRSRQEVKRSIAAADAGSIERDAQTQGQLHDLAAQVAHLTTLLTAEAGATTATPDAASAGAAGKAIQTTLASDDPTTDLARDALLREDFDGAVTALMAAARADVQAAATRLREAGAIAYYRNGARAIEAYAEATRIDPSDAWTFIFLARLYRRGGNTALARTAAERSLEAATNERDRGAALSGLGDVACQEGDLAAARKAYEDSLAIAKVFAERHPKNTQWQHDLSVSFNKLGDVARQEGDLAAARKAYEDSVAIATTLSARDPNNTDWQRALSDCFSSLGDVARQEGDLAAARNAHQDSLTIRTALAARDPGNTNWQRDLSVSYERLGDVAETEGGIDDASSLYERSLSIAEALAAKDRTNAGFQNDVQITRRRLAELRARLA